MSDDKQELIDALKQIANMPSEAVDIARKALLKHSPKPWWVKNGFVSEPKDNDFIICSHVCYLDKLHHQFGHFVNNSQDFYKKHIHPIPCPSYLKPKLGLWAAVDKDGSRWIFRFVPSRGNTYHQWVVRESHARINANHTEFDHIFVGKSWTDEPWEV
jgi:hypothetical protein